MVKLAAAREFASLAILAKGTPRAVPTFRMGTFMVCFAEAKG